MPQLNINISDTKKEKLDWLSTVLDEAIATIVRDAIEAKYEEVKAQHQQDSDFMRWIRSNRS